MIDPPVGASPPALAALPELWRREVQALHDEAGGLDGCNGRPNDPARAYHLRLQAESKAGCAAQLTEALTARSQEQAPAARSTAIPIGQLVVDVWLGPDRHHHAEMPSGERPDRFDAVCAAVWKIFDSDLPARSQDQPPRWQPIETAPKDGTKIALARVEPEHRNHISTRVATGYWFSTQRDTHNGDASCGWLGLLEPTHWMPLPDPPVVAARYPTTPHGETK